MASANAGDPLAGSSGHVSKPAVMLFATVSDQMAALSTGAAIGFTASGAAAAGLVMFVAFNLVNWLGKSKSSKDTLPDSSATIETPLLEKGNATSQECSSWHEAAPALEASAQKAEAPVSWSVLTTAFLMALPSLLGSWCWPLLLVALFPAMRGFESDSNREAFHHITFGADIVLFGIVIWYVGRMASRSPRSQVFTSIWGPFMVVTLACVLLMMDPTRHVLLDHGGVFFEEKTLAMYSHTGLSPIGKFCQWASISGFVLLIGGVAWHMRVPEFSGTGLGKTL